MKTCISCGIEKPLSEYYKRKDRINSTAGECKSCKTIRGKNNKIKQMSTLEGHVKNLFWHAKSRAKQRNLKFNITIEYLISIIPKTCPIFKSNLAWGKVSKRAMHNTPSLDRINPKLGYIVGNVQWISWRANTVKNDLTFKELNQFANWIIAQKYLKKYQKN